MLISYTEALFHLDWLPRSPHRRLCEVVEGYLVVSGYLHSIALDLDAAGHFVALDKGVSNT